MTDDKKWLSQGNPGSLSIANIPRGLSAALAEDLNAMQIFAEMPDEPRNAFIMGAKDITDRAQLRQYVKELRRNTPLPKSYK